MLTPLAENLWLLAYPLTILGLDIRRNVTVIRLASGELVIHSTGPFTAEDQAAVAALGPVGWMADAMLDHDTFASRGRASFPGCPYLAPQGFSAASEPLLPAPAAWAGQIEVLKIEGAPSFSEHVFWHRPSRTLIVADLVFNFEAPPFFAKLLLGAAITSGARPGMSRRFLHAVTDRAALSASLERMMQWDFDRVVVGHGDVIRTGAREKLRRLFTGQGFLS